MSISALLTVSLVRDGVDRGEPLFSSQVLDVTARVEAITALRESERRLRAIVENTVEGIVVVDDDATIETANPAACAISGRKLPALVGIAFDELLGAHEPFARIRTAIRSRRDVSEAEVVVQTPVGAAVPVELSLVADVLPSRHLLIMRDVSDERALEQGRQRLDQERRIAQRLEAVGQLAAGIAHEINTPVQFIGDSTRFVGSAFEDLQPVINAYRALGVAVAEGRADAPELAMAALGAQEDADLAYLQERVPAAIERSSAGIERIREIVGAMREFGHTGSDSHDPSDINHAIQSVLTVARSEYKYVADVETELGDLPLVACNIGEVSQVFLNLIVNAAHAIDAARDDDGGRGTIRIRTGRENGTALISITDTGTGIPVEIRERIFDPFFTTKEAGKGTGQGLAISRSIVVDKHHGTITLDTAPGRGTMFTIRLPIADRRSITPETESPHAAAA